MIFKSKTAYGDDADALSYRLTFKFLRFQMRADISGSLIAGVYLHEVGQAVAGWVNGVAVVPTPAKEYILQSQLD